jgi:hypothetical protein
MLEGMFKDIASKEDLKKLESMYAAGHKGAAEVFMLKKIVPQWVVMFNHYEKSKHTPLPDVENKHTFKMYYKGSLVD